MSLWLFIWVIFIFSAVLAVRVPFPFGVRGRLLNSIYRFLIIALLSTLYIISSPILQSESVKPKFYSYKSDMMLLK